MSDINSFHLTGASRLYIIIGDPIAQVKSPGGMTAGFAARGLDAIMVPVQVKPDDLIDCLSLASRLGNLDGIIATIPHKFSCLPHCKTHTERAGFITSVNMMRRNADGSWHGDMSDGYGFMEACRRQGFEAGGKTALLIGAGGAGSAIAYELVDRGVTKLAIFDPDQSRRDGLIARLSALGKAEIVVGTPDPKGFDFIANASPVGMKPSDPLPVKIEHLSQDTFVGCVITQPDPSPLVAAARAKGCQTSTGVEMYQSVQGMMLDFFLHHS
jgi:shikimate dehydrogenase